jgi:hypothetical protein
MKKSALKKIGDNVMSTGYIAKPKIFNNIGVKKFKTATKAIDYLDAKGVETYSTKQIDKVEELIWIGKLIELPSLVGDKILKEIEELKGAYIGAGNGGRPAGHACGINQGRSGDWRTLRQGLIGESGTFFNHK